MVKSPPAEPPGNGMDEDLEAELAAALPETQQPSFARRWALHVLPFLLLAAAVYVLWREFHDIRLAEVGAAMRAWGPETVLAALALSAASFLLMGLSEWMGLNWAGARLRLRSALAGSFIANAIAHSLGANLLVSGAVRARYYARHKVGLRQVAATTLFHGVSFGVGLSFLAGVSLLVARGSEITVATSIAKPVADGMGLLLVGGVVAYVGLCATPKRPLRAFGHQAKLPSVKVALAQIGLGAIDNATAAGIVWVLLPAGSVTFVSFVGAYAPSVVLGLLSHVPGGVGVFEGSVSALLSGVDRAPLAAAFLGYRLAFFLLPLALAAVALLADTLLRRART